MRRSCHPQPNSLDGYSCSHPPSFFLIPITPFSLPESGVLQEQLSKSRPLDSEDLKLIEQDLSQQLHSGLGTATTRLEGVEGCVTLENGGRL